MTTPQRARSKEGLESINHIGHLMGIQTIAEFVETKEILDKITAIGIDFAQGHGIAKPRPLCFNNRAKAQRRKGK